MTYIDHQALRDFMATEVMGWTIHHNTQTDYPSGSWYYEEERGYITEIYDWKPDIDSNQLDMLIDKMVGDGWSYKLVRSYFGDIWQATIYNEKNGTTYPVINFDRRLAVLLAIKAAKET